MARLHHDGAVAVARGLLEAVSMAGVVTEASSYPAEVLLRDGGRVRIRAIRPDDRDRLRDHFQSLSRESVYNRFLSFKSSLTENEVRGLTELDFDRHVGLVATALDEGPERILGVARYVVLERAAPGRVEMAVAVSDDQQGRGIGTALLEHLARLAIARGLHRFEADIHDGNERMLRMLRHSGLSVGPGSGGVVHVCVRLEEAAPALE
jgi:GNAT superfamily N-acetyltransferase